MATPERLAICGIVLFHLVCFRKFYFQNPWCYATSELLEQVFPSTLHLGRHLRRYGLWTLHPVDDPYYYADYSALPFLSSYYPPHRITAWLMTFLPTDQSFWILCLTMVWHFLAASLVCFALLQQMGWSILSALFGTITLSHLGYAMKQNSCIVYTCAWVPIFILCASLHQSILFGISLGMMLLAGYWPIAFYAIPLGCLVWLLA